jgi:hypothetical protein
MVFALTGGAAFYYYVLRDWAGFGFGDFTGPSAGIYVGEGRFVKRTIPLDGRIDWVTDVFHGDLDADLGAVFGVASAEGILLLDGELEQKNYAAIVEYVNEIRFVFIPSKGSYFVYNNGSWDDEDTLALFDLTGKRLWAFDSPDGPASMEAGDLDGNGNPEFCIVYSDDEYDDVETLIVLDADGQELWRKEIQYTWDFTVADITGDGLADICVLNNQDLLAIETSNDATKPISEAAIPDASLLTTVKWPASDPEKENILLVLDGKFQIIDAFGNTVQAMTAPDLDYPNDIRAASISFEAGGPKHLAVIANGGYYPDYFTQFYVYDPNGELLYYEVLGSYTAALTPIFSETGQGRIILGGEDRLFEYALADSSSAEE